MGQAHVCSRGQGVPTDHRASARLTVRLATIWLAMKQIPRGAFGRARSALARVTIRFPAPSIPSSRGQMPRGASVRVRSVIARMLTRFLAPLTVRWALRFGLGTGGCSWPVTMAGEFNC